MPLQEAKRSDDVLGFDFYPGKKTQDAQSLSTDGTWRGETVSLKDFLSDFQLKCDSGESFKKKNPIWAFFLFLTTK